VGTISKSKAGYLYAPTTDYKCEECQFVKEKDTRCAYFGPKVLISGPTGGCNLFKAGTSLDLPYLAPFFTKQQAGYMENREGFGCRRCGEFLVGKNDCREIDKDSPGDTPHRIDPRACCDFWGPDKKRASMTNAQLVKITSTAPSLKRLSTTP
jgi:hypothetical protein